MVHALEGHTAAGRLTLDEYAERVDRTLAARTQGDLARITGDLPPEPPAPTAEHSGHQITIAFLIAFLGLLVVAGLVTAFR